MKILFLCTGNSCRSQMTEGLVRHLKGDVIEPCSAGIEMHGMNPFAVAVMKEIGIDISGQRSKHVDDLKDMEFDYVITVCGHAYESCPIFSGKAKLIHVSFDDPPQLATLCHSDEAKLDCYRRVRDEIKQFVEGMPTNLTIHQ